jgi:hypothetical protein
MQSTYKVRGLEWVGATKGALIYFDEDDNGDVIGYLLPTPADWAAQEEAGTPYVLGIADGIPTWRLVTEDVVSGGWGVSWGTSWG